MRATIRRVFKIGLHYESSQPPCTAELSLTAHNMHNEAANTSGISVNITCRAGKHGKAPYRYENVTLPKAVDWTTKGIVGPVKNQHVNGSACGCCWTFATTGVVECIVAMATGKPISLSEQQLIDCDRAGDKRSRMCPGL